MKKEIVLSHILIAPPMPFRKISQDVKIAAINLYNTNICTVEELCHFVGFSERTFWLD
jgi:hypothetical protein